MRTPDKTTRAIVTMTTAIRWARSDHPRRRDRGVTGSGRSVVGRARPSAGVVIDGDSRRTGPRVGCSPMRVTMMLCDAAQVAEGKLFVLGGGWSITGAQMGPSAIALKLEVPWDQTNVAHHWELYLVDADGRPVTIQTDDGQQAIEVRGDFEVGRPPGLPTGAPLDVPIAVNLPPLPVHGGERYEWRLTIDGESNEDWSVAFTTLAVTEPA